MQKGADLVSRTMLVRIQSSALLRLSSGCGGGTQLCESCRPGSTPGGDTLLDAGARGPGGRLQPGRSGFDSHRHLFCPWSVTDALDFPKVADQVRLLAGT